MNTTKYFIKSLIEFGLEFIEEASVETDKVTEKVFHHRQNPILLLAPTLSQKLWNEDKDLFASQMKE